MKKIWFLYINDAQEGPYSYLELSKDDRLTLETYVWREGMDDWQFLGDVDELIGLVDEEEKSRDDDAGKKDSKVPNDDEIALEIRNGRPYSWLWLLIILLLLLLTFYEIFWSS